MAISVVQSVKNASAYLVTPLVATLPSKTTTGSFLVVTVEAQKTGYPYSSGQILANTPPPIVTDDQGNVYTLVDKLVDLSQDSAAVQPDAAGFLPSAYVYVTSSQAAANTQNIYVAAFYPDEYTSPLQPGPSSPPYVNGRPVFDGGLHVQAFEVAGLGTGVDAHANGQTTTAGVLGGGIITTANTNAIIFEVGLLIDSAALITNTNSTLQYQQILWGGSSHYVVQSRIVASATANTGFSNALDYQGGVIAVSLK